MSKIKQRALSLFLCLATVVQMGITVPVAAAEPKGTGTEKAPYQIASQADLEWMAEQINLSPADYESAFYQLTEDIELESAFTPINSFSGTLDGDGHTISGLNIDASTKEAALIVNNNGTVRDLGLANVAMTGTYVSNSLRAGVVAKNYGTIEGCYVTGSLGGGHMAGGLVAANYGTVRNCYFLGELDANWEIGGIVAKNYQQANAQVENCYAGGTLTSRNNNIGFITGYTYGDTRITGNVALYGSARSQKDISRLCNRNNGVTDESVVFQNNLACEDILLNGGTVTGTAADRNGQDTTVQALTEQETYTAIGWDFEKVWTMDEALGRPVLQECSEVEDAVYTPELTGKGTQEDPYQIADQEALEVAVCAMNHSREAAEAYYQLTDDIQLEGEVPSVQNFAGVFDGNGHKLVGLKLSRTYFEFDALFLVNNGVIRDLGLEDVSITGPDTAETSRRAPLCYRNYGEISGCYVTGNVSGGHRSGGIVAENYAEIHDCYFVGTLIGRCESAGITAWNQNTGSVTNCYVQGSVTTETNNSGFIGAYGYAGTIYQGNVVLSGSTLTTANAKNFARICGRNKGETTFIDNLACEDATINGNVVTDGAADNLNGLSKTAEELTQVETYTAIGWDFTDVWTMDETMQRPVLRACRQEAPEPEQPVEEDLQSFTVESPDKSIMATVFVSASGELGYSVQKNGTDVLLRASLGLTVNDVDMGQGVTLGEPVKTTFDETYTTVGMHTQARNYYNQSAFSVTKGDLTITLNVRAYDDGIAIQYAMPDGAVTISEDHTRFALPTDAKAFIQYGANADGSMNYASIKNMQSASTATTVANMSEGRLLCTLPTFELKDKAAYICLTEANLYDWSGMGLRVEKNGVLKAEYWDENGKTFTTEGDSPWRLAIICDNLTDFVNSDMVTNVSDPEDEELFGDKSWIQYGRSVWTTLGGGPSTIEGYKQYSDYASQLGIEFNLIESRNDFGSTLEQQFAAIKEIVDYSAALENPVKIWIWEDAPTSRYDGGLYVEENAREFLQSCVDAGVVGVKIDHIHSEAPDKVNFYEDFTKLAAEYHIMVSYHNPMKPTGLSRTYPNEITREAIRGMQSGCNVNDNTILPFTRLLAGGADYTPLNFSDGSKLGSASWAHMMANTVIMTSGYLQLSENPKNLVDKLYTDFVKALPAVWDETWVLDQSEIGTVAAYLRRSGNDYYLAVQNGSKGAQEMTFDLDFLPDGKWNADIYYDNLYIAADVKRTVEQVDNQDSLSASIRSGGGYVVRFTQEEVNYESDQDKVFEINSVEDLDQIRKHPDATFNLNTDLELTGTVEPIPVLGGTFNGNGHTISGLRVSDTDASAAFILQNNGTIRQLGLTDVWTDGPYTSSKSWRAALCVKNYGTIEECYALGHVAGGHRNGGLVAENYNTIRNCYFIGTLESNYEVGGITAFNHNGSATVENCYASGTMLTRNNNSGFISGYAYSGTRMIGNVALGGEIISKSAKNLGRICGRNNGVDEATTYQNNLACADITINGSTVTSSNANSKDGLDKIAEDLKQQATYEGIGWDFDGVWSFDTARERPVLKNVAEKNIQKEIATADTIWSYQDDGTDPAAGQTDRTAWTKASFDDSAWSTGKGSFGAKNNAIADLGGGCVPHTLLTQYKTGTSTDIETYYFRTTVTVEDPAGIESITGSLVYDDAAIVYINGQVAASFDTDRITANQQYSGTETAQPKVGEINITDAGHIASLLKAGENIVAVELHQGSASSDDVYLDFTALNFNKKAVVEQNSISLSPGSDESQMNFTWYASTEEAGIIRVAKAADLVDGAMPEDTIEVTAASAESNKTGFYYNQCTVTGLEPDTEYAYQLVNGETVSAVYTFTTAKDDSFTFLFVGDPQLGASGDLTGDMEGWAQTLAAAVKKVPDAAFLLSAGDQVNTADNEKQYSAYLERTQLYNLPVATVVGNHDSSSNAYDQHFNVANESADYGCTNAGGDYWFRYNDVLFLVLNVNDMSTAEHKAFMEEAIAQNEDVSWKIVAMHHSVYSVATHATEGDILQRRNQLVPVFQELDVDVVLQGHDHVYVRSYMMDGLIPVTDVQSYDNAEMTSVTDTDDILYVTGNSASGSKYYDIQQNVEFAYAAVKSQEYTPTYSEVSLSDSQFCITTYRVSDGSVLDTFAINRTVESDDSGSTGGSSSGSGSASYRVNVAESANGTVAIEPARAAKGDTVTVTVQANTGHELEKLKVTAANGSEVNLTDCGNGVYTFTMPGSAVAVSASFSKVQAETSFRDVASSAYYAEAVAWAVEEGITSGTSKDTFSPNATCTRAQTVTFLWKLAGSPEPEGAQNPFVDVSTDDYYYNAVLWAVKNGITAGTSETTFSPNATVTRGQVVTLLWSAQGKPAVPGAAAFVDVSQDAYYAKAVAWAVEEEITAGTSETTFSPDAGCTRAQIVTFLFRCNK